MRSVGLKVLKNKLSEYVRLAAGGETVLVTDRDRVVAEIVPPQSGRSPFVADAMLAQAVREGWVTPPLLAGGGPPPRRPVMVFDDLMDALRQDREDPVIYLDSSVALAHLLAEDRSPPETLWRQPLISSRLLEYEVWNRIHARKLERSHGDDVRALIDRIALIELAPPVLARALEPFPIPVRTLDALHLASIEFLRARGQKIELATYDDRLAAAARLLAISQLSL